MREIRRSILLLCLGSMSIPTLDIAARGADEPAAQVPPGYSSPREAYEARRKALAERDWRISFASSTTAVQALEVENLVRRWILMEMLQLELPGDDKIHYDRVPQGAGVDKLRATMKKYGLEFSDFSPLSLGLLIDEEKVLKTAASRVADKAAFYRELSEIIRPRGQETPERIHDFGDLQGIEESGDSASGWVVWKREQGRKPARLLRKFRRVDGRWLNDSETWDYTLWHAVQPAQVPPGYPSPREAYEAKRKALAERDWRTSFASSTPAAQDLEIEHIVGWWFLMDEGGKVGPFVNRELGAAAEHAMETKLRLFMKKNGVKKPLIFFGDEQIRKMFETLASHKAAFYEGAYEGMMPVGRESPESEYDMGDLQGVEVSGDTARGWVVWDRDYDYENGVRKTKKGPKTVRLLRKFRKLDGRWFNDNVTWDYTHFDPEEVKK
jgi:hypothetical protein